ncbi:hypothetical protein NLG42_19355 [Flavobacterium plurextorum]|uniref:hypothetical protein n=1 Tax=Flavobacterium TaxID=237 RepID=UPI00214DA8D1|nr:MULTISPECIES: hypothetical protein [Flavobacterium]UUW08252.1 hypothetical protein NLG42_19355 [Flavobacterium plurextorum]
MKSVLKKQNQDQKELRLYVMVKLWWVRKMNSLTKDLSKSQLYFFLIFFSILGTTFCFYTAIKGVVVNSSESIRIDGVSAIKSVYNDQVFEPYFMDTAFKGNIKKSYLSSYVDSVINTSSPIYLNKIDTSRAKDFYSIMESAENNKANNKK